MFCSGQGPHFGGLGGGPGPHFGGLGRHRGHGLDRERAQERQNEFKLHSRAGGSTDSEAPGILGTARFEGDFVAFWPYSNLTTDCQDDRRPSRKS